jgi:DNA-binding CsgD family transcriptional regulator
MSRGVSWTAAVLALVNAALAFSLVLPIHRARATAKAEKSTLGGRIGLLIELGLLAYGAGALLRGTCAVLAAVGAGSAERLLKDWGLLSVSATVLVLFLAMWRDFLPVMYAVRRSERALGVVLGAFEPALLNPQNLDLSVRELEVLAVIAAGKVSDQEIADILFISPSTAATHVRNILKKAGLHDRRQLVLIGLRDEPA